MPAMKAARPVTPMQRIALGLASITRVIGGDPAAVSQRAHGAPPMHDDHPDVVEDDPEAIQLIHDALYASTRSRFRTRRHGPRRT
jgi:hypothetical protein